MKNPLITMSAVTGKPTGEQIHTYLQSLRASGIRQVMLYPRSGCELAYLEEEWFAVIGEFIRAAGELEMTLWLYDDFNWPSGNGGGRVTAVEAFRLKSIDIIGEEKGTIRRSSTNDGSLFGEKFYPDLMNGAAVDSFIAGTHEEYRKRFGQHFGREIRGIFTDEPSVAYCCTEKSIPYYEGIEEDYRRFCGRDFHRDLHGGHPDFRADAMTVIGERFHRCYTKKLSDWCRECGLLLTGHLMRDDEPWGATAQSGDYLKNLSALDVPGIDCIETDFRADTLFTLLGGTQYARGEHGAMAELFALGPCDMSFAKKRAMLYLCACFGIDHYFLAVSHMDMRGNAKITDFFNNYAEDQPDFAGTRLLTEEAEQAAALSAREFSPDVYVLYPADLCRRTGVSAEHRTAFLSLIRQLTHHQIQWKYAADPSECGDTPMVAFTDSMDFVCGSLRFTDAGELCRSLQIPLRVTKEDGTAPEGVFVRVFADGSAAAVNLFGEAGTYLLDGEKFFLSEHGVCLSEALADEPDISRREEWSAEFSVRYGNPNRIRAMFIDESTRAVVECAENTEVIFSVRRDTSLRFDGQPVQCGEAGEHLSRGLRSLYGDSARMLLRNGEHLLESGGDHKYLPSVILTGDFAAETKNGEICRLLLTPRRKTVCPGEYVTDFGEVTFCASVKVPADAVYLELDGTKLYTRLYVDGELAGACIFSPYRFQIRPEWRGRTVRLEIVQASGMAPMFGDVAYYDAVSRAVKWRGTPLPENNRFGFSFLSWLF